MLSRPDHATAAANGGDKTKALIMSIKYGKIDKPRDDANWIDGVQSETGKTRRSSSKKC